MASKVATSNARRPAPTPARRSPPPPPRSAATKPTPPAPQRQAAPPATAKTPPALTTPPTDKKPPRKRSAPMDRALKFVRLADRNLNYGLRLVGNWRGEATAEQKAMNDETVAKLKEAAPLVERALLDVGLLAKTGFVPIEARGRAITEPFAAGERVAISEKQYKPALHGAVNDFEVVVQVENMVKIRLFGDLKSPQLIVQRGHLTGFEDPEEGEEEDTEEGRGEGENEGEEEVTADGAEGAGGEGDGDAEDTAELNFDEPG